MKTLAALALATLLTACDTLPQESNPDCFPEPVYLNYTSLVIGYYVDCSTRGIIRRLDKLEGKS